MIELMVVIAIIGLLSSIILVSLGRARSAARDAIRYNDIRQINNAIQLYVLEHNYAPLYREEVYVVKDYDTVAWSSLGTLLAPYLPKMPRDPCGTSCPGAGDPGWPWFSYQYITPYNMGIYCDGDPSCAGSVPMSYKIFAESLEKNFQKFGFTTFGSI